MTDEQKEPEAEPPKAEAATKPKKKPKVKAAKASKPVRAQSSIAFPYMDLDTAVAVARSILGAGGVALTREQLAGVMNQAVGSGNFVQKIATTRMFGLMEYTNGKYELTGLGHAILDRDENTQRDARSRAFLTVPLYKKIYEEFRGRQLPPRPNGLEQAIVTFGVAMKQKSNARLAFDKSAAQAGFFGRGNDRLIPPILGPTGPTGPSGPTGASPNGPTGPVWRPTSEAQEIAEPMERRTQQSGLHPFIQGLLSTLPAPDSTWKVEGRAKWLQAAANIFDLIYKGDGEITIQSVPGSGNQDKA